MPKNYLLIYSEQLATEIELLCQNIKAPSNTLFRSVKVRAVFMQTFVKQIMGRVNGRKTRATRTFGRSFP